MMTTEHEWLSFLKEKPQWSVPQGRTVLLSPHPDDETLGAGGLIADLRQKNRDVLIISLTDGELAYPKISNLRQIRQREQEQALHLLGVEKEQIIRLQLTDSSIHLMEEKLEELLLTLIHKQDHIIAPWIGDYHSDHEAAGRVALKIAQQRKIHLSFYFFWTWHYSAVTDLEEFPLGIYSLDEATFQLKQDALNCYVSQYSEQDGRAVLPKHLLIPTQRNFEVYYTYEH